MCDLCVIIYIIHNIISFCFFHGSRVGFGDLCLVSQMLQIKSRAPPHTRAIHTTMYPYIHTIAARREKTWKLFVNRAVNTEQDRAEVTRAGLAEDENNLRLLFNICVSSSAHICRLLKCLHHSTHFFADTSTPCSVQQICCNCCGIYPLLSSLL